MFPSSFFENGFFDPLFSICFQLRIGFQQKNIMSVAIGGTGALRRGNLDPKVQLEFMQCAGAFSPAGND